MDGQTAHRLQYPFGPMLANGKKRAAAAPPPQEFCPPLPIENFY